jgi:hypothetical protein
MAFQPDDLILNGSVYLILSQTYIEKKMKAIPERVTAIEAA